MRGRARAVKRGKRARQAGLAQGSASGGGGRGLKALGQMDVFALGEPGGRGLSDHIAEEIVDEMGGAIDRLVHAGPSGCPGHRQTTPAAAHPPRWR